MKKLTVNASHPPYRDTNGTKDTNFFGLFVDVGVHRRHQRERGDKHSYGCGKHEEQTQNA